MVRPATALTEEPAIQWMDPVPVPMDGLEANAINDPAWIYQLTDLSVRSFARVIKTTLICKFPFGILCIKILYLEW